MKKQLRDVENRMRSSDIHVNGLLEIGGMESGIEAVL